MEAVPTWNLTKAAMLIQVLGKAVRATSLALELLWEPPAVVKHVSSGKQTQT